MFCVLFCSQEILFKVGHVHDSIRSVILYLFACCICVHFYCACVFVFLHDCT